MTGLFWLETMNPFIFHDEHAVGVYKFESDDAETMLVGHVPIELSMLLSRFLKASEKNAVEVKVCGKRRREVGLVISGHYKVLTKSRSHRKILDRELNYMKTKYSHFEIEHELSEERILMPYIYFQLYFQKDCLYFFHPEQTTAISVADVQHDRALLA